MPDNYKLSDDPMQAPLGLSILEVKFNVGGEFTPEYTDVLVQYLAENTSIFDESILVRKTASRNGFEAVYQRWYNEDDNTWIKLQGVFFTNETAYVFNLINNLEGETYSDKVADVLCDVANDWFNRIRLADEVGKPFFMYAKPDEDLYPHYDKLRSSGSTFAGMNVTVVTNASGTEFSCLPVDDFTDDALAEKINSLDKASYTLADEADKMAPLFRVNKDKFNSREDRENDIMVCNMRRAYHQHALRSFAWTAADYCEENGIFLSDLSEDEITSICNHIENVGWLNYKKNSHFPELCGNSDLHVFYVPDKTTKADRKALTPKQESILDGMFGYSPINSTVGSLDNLRKDLENIYPAIAIAYNMLAKKRDRRKPLDGAMADVVYAWCVLAKGAKAPFFTEDGPMNCFYSWLGEAEELQAKWEAEEAARAEKDAEEWMNQYGKYVQKNPVVDFNGSIFVFSGLAFHSVEKDHPTVSKVIEKGGQYRSKVSGLTNYLVVNPGYAGTSKIVAVEEQLEKGKNIKVILLEDFEKALGISKTNSDKPAEKNNSRAVGSEKVSSTAESKHKKSAPTKSKKVVLPDGVHLTDGGYVTVNDDWAIKLPADWVYAADCENSCNKPFASMEYKEYKKYGNSSIAYGDNCFTVFRADEKSDAIASLASLVGPMLSGKDSYSIITRSDLTVSVSYNDDGATTYGQYVNVETSKYMYTIQYFYTDAKKSATQRHNEMEKVLRTIVLSNEVPTDAVCKSISSVKSNALGDTSLSQCNDNIPKSFVVRGTTLVKYTGKAFAPEIPAEVTVIGEGAFADNNSVHEIAIRQGVTKIESGAFHNCKLYTVLIAPSVTDIAEDAFSVDSILDSMGTTTLKIVKNSYADKVLKESVEFSYRDYRRDFEKEYID
ncbi:MAG: leucine-rich repeat protein, partial [Acutalibacteraceae bacterium]|nr:leucine-rich repeat protein [Acutalibacteraceae bacterium]